MSRRNRISVQHRKNVHTAGSRSFARIAASEAKDGKNPSLAAVYIKTMTTKGGQARVDEKTREELKKLAEDDSQVEEYLVANNLLKRRPGSVLLKGRGVTKTAVRKAKYKEEANKKAEEKVDRVRAECVNTIEAFKEQFTVVIQNLVARLQTSNGPQEFANFNPFEGCLDFYSSSDDSYVPDDNACDDESDVSLVTEYWESDEESGEEDDASDDIEEDASDDACD